MRLAVSVSEMKSLCIAPAIRSIRVPYGTVTLLPPGSTPALASVTAPLPYVTPGPLPRAPCLCQRPFLRSCVAFCCRLRAGRNLSPSTLACNSCFACLLCCLSVSPFDLPDLRPPRPRPRRPRVARSGCLCWLWHLPGFVYTLLLPPSPNQDGQTDIHTRPAPTSLRAAKAHPLPIDGIASETAQQHFYADNERRRPPRRPLRRPEREREIRERDSDRERQLTNKRWPPGRTIRSRNRRF